MDKIYLILMTFCLVCCGDNVSDKFKDKGGQSEDKFLLELNTDIVENNVLFGNDIVKEFDFETSWMYADWSGNNYEVDSINEPKFIELYNDTLKFSYDTSLTNYNYVENNNYLDYYVPLKHAFDSTMKGFGSYLAQTYFKLGEIKLVLFSCGKFEPEQQASEYSYSYSRTDLVTYDKNGEEIDGLPIQFTAGRSIIEYDRFFYLDSNSILHLIDFFSDEEYRNVVREEKWKVRDDGFFVRYFEQDDGMFLSDSEKGEVVNKMKEGEWIEIKSRQFSPLSFKSLSFVEGNYKGGIPYGMWYYYDLSFDYEHTEEGLVEIEGSEKKGKLIYTEEYNQSGLIERVFY